MRAYDFYSRVEFLIRINEGKAKKWKAKVKIFTKGSHVNMLRSVIVEAQSTDIHDALNAQGFAMRYRAISNRASHSEFFEWKVYFIT